MIINTKRKILIVDDSIENLKFMVSVFNEFQNSYEIYQTVKPEVAIEIAEKTIPNLIITDWNMPNISGIGLINLFKKNPKLKEIPIIMATGEMISNADLETALEAGAIDYIRKPIDPTELIARTKSALKLTEYYKKLVDQKNKELTENSLYLIKGQEFNRNISQQIELTQELIKTNSSKAIEKLTELKRNILERINEDRWYKFNVAFSEVHRSFHKNLTENHPNLTPAELKLCTFIRLGMANKEIASVLNQTTDGIKTSRYRLRKKLNIVGVNLESYIAGF